MNEENKRAIIATKCPKCQQTVRFYRPTEDGIVKITCPHAECGHVFGVKISEKEIKLGTGDNSGQAAEQQEEHKPTDPIFNTGSAPSGVIARLLQKKRHFFCKDKYHVLHPGANTIGMYDPASPSDIMIEGDYTISHRSITITVEAAGSAYKYLLTVNKATNPVYLSGKSVAVSTSVYIQPRQEIVLGKTKLCLVSE